MDKTFKIGERVSVRASFGLDAPRIVVVNDIDEKNGRPLIIYTDQEGNGRWAYFTQCEKL